MPLDEFVHHEGQEHGGDHAIDHPRARMAQSLTD
jgi:hypothetical protein